MKLRMTHNSIRLRIRKSEIVKLQQDHLVEESVKFPTGQLFKFYLMIDKEINSLNAEWKESELVVSIPNTEAIDWITTNKVSLETEIELDEKEQLHLLIEKDFPCLDRAEEDKSDTFWELAPESPESC